MHSCSRPTSSPIYFSPGPARRCGEKKSPAAEWLKNFPFSPTEGKEEEDGKMQGKGGRRRRKSRGERFAGSGDNFVVDPPPFLIVSWAEARRRCAEI